MKKLSKLWGIIVFAAVIGFSFAACDDGNGTGSQASVPGAPKGVTATRDSSNSTTVTVSWNAVSGAASYKVYYSITGSGSGDLESTSTTLSYSSTGKGATETHYFRVSAVNSAGEEGSLSAWVSVGPVSNGGGSGNTGGGGNTVTVPGAPANVTATRDSSDPETVNISWNAVSGVSSYKVYHSYTGSDSGSWEDTIETTSYISTGKGETITHYFRVIAWNSAGDESSPSEWVRVGPKPDAPTGVTASRDASDLTIVNISWNAVSEATSYKVYYSVTASGTGTLNGTSETTSYSSTGNGTGNLYFRVSAVSNSAGEGSPSAWVLVVYVSKPNVPIGVTATRDSSTPSTVNISWNAVSGATSYKVYYSPTNSGTGTLDGTSETTSFSSTGNPTGATYYFKVSAVNSAGEGTSSAWVSVGPVSGEGGGNTVTVPGVPTNVTATRDSSTPTTVNISWNAVSGATGYKVYYSTTGSGSGTLDNTSTTTSFTSRNNTATKTYYFKVSAVNSAGEGSSSAWVSVGPVSSGGGGNTGGGGGSVSTPKTPVDFLAYSNSPSSSVIAAVQYRTSDKSTVDNYAYVLYIDGQANFAYRNAPNDQSDSFGTSAKTGNVDGYYTIVISDPLSYQVPGTYRVKVRIYSQKTYTGTTPYIDTAEKTVRVN